MDFSRELLSTITLNESLKVIKRTANELIPHDVFSPYWVDETMQALRPMEFNEENWLSSPVFQTWSIPFGQGIIGDVVREQKPIRINNSHLDSRSIYPPGFREKFEREHSIYLPLHSGNKFIGVLVLLRRADPPFTKTDFEMTQIMVSLAELALGNARMFSELESKNEELERFTYTVSHDLKSPLVTINGFLGYLEQDAASGNMERLKKDIQRIQEAVHKMQKLLNELLELSRVGRMMNAPETLSFENLMDEVLEILQGRLNESGATVHIQPNLPPIYGDKPRMIEVLQNLLDNAAKYMGDQPEPRIDVGYQGEENGMPVFFVKDNGMGIDPKHHERIFGLFNKLDARSEGTGVGLALVKRIVEVHGGRIWVQSEASPQGNAWTGSTFYFTFPSQPKPDFVI